MTTYVYGVPLVRTIYVYRCIHLYIGLCVCARNKYVYSVVITTVCEIMLFVKVRLRRRRQRRRRWLRRRWRLLYGNFKGVYAKENGNGVFLRCRGFVFLVVYRFFKFFLFYLVSYLFCVAGKRKEKSKNRFSSRNWRLVCV